MNLGLENEILEFKETTGELHQAIESIAAILNKHNAGVLYFGVLDNGDVKGQIISDNTIKNVTDGIYRDIEPRIVPTVQRIALDGKEVIKVSFSGKQVPYSAFGKFLIRVGTQNRQMTRDELRKLIKNEDYSYPWEKEKNSSGLDDIDNDSLKSYYDEAVGCGRLVLDTYNDKELLTILELYKDGALNNAAIALFGKSAGIGLKVATFATNEKITFTDLKLFKGNIYQLYNKAISYISDHINWRLDIGIKSETIPEIPLEAIREIVINAFAHAIYEPTPEIEINVFPGMITISNPGSFPDELTPIDFINDDISSIKRNPLILDVLYRCKNVEKSGTGFKRVNKVCSKNGIRWDFKETAYGFSFTFYRTNKSYARNIENNDLTDLEEKVYRLINNNVKISREEIANILGIGIRSVQRITNSLVKKGYLLRIGNNRFGYWELKDN